MQLAEKYRPQSWADVVGQQKVIDRLLALAARGGLAGRAYWLSGQRRTGQTNCHVGRVGRPTHRALRETRAVLPQQPEGDAASDRRRGVGRLRPAPCEAPARSPGFRKRPDFPTAFTLGVSTMFSLLD